MKKFLDIVNNQKNSIRKKICEKIKLENVILVTLTMYLINLQLQYTTFNITDLSLFVFKVWRYICYIIFILVAMLNFDFSIKKWKNYLLLLLVSIITITSKDLSLIILLAVYFACKDINFKQIVKIYIYTSIICFIIVLISSSFRIIPNWTFERTAEHLRNSLGYQFCTFASVNFFFMTLLKFYDCNGKFTDIEAALIIIVSLLLYMLTDSRTGLILNFFIVFSSYFIKVFNYLNIYEKLKKYKIWIDKCGKILFKILVPLMVLFSIFLVVAFKNFNSNTFVQKLDDVLSNRLYYTNVALEKYDITLFGQEIKWQGLGGYGYTVTEQFEYSFVDNCYINMMLNYGVVFLLVFIFLYSRKLYTVYVEKKYMLLYCLVLISFWAMIEPGILSITKNIFILIL